MRPVRQVKIKKQAVILINNNKAYGGELSDNCVKHNANIDVCSISVLL